MSQKHLLRSFLFATALVVAPVVATASTAQATGVLGSPSTKTTLDGRHLPEPPAPFGGVIRTPGLERIAKTGLRFTQFHSTALCSPTRAALITGRNHHSVGIGELSTGYPGYNSIIGEENAAT